MQTLRRQLWLFYLLPVLGLAAIVVNMSGLERFSDWLGQEGQHVLLWWFMVSMAGWAAFPLMFRLVPSLADRGYGVSRLAGMLLTAFLLWFLTSLGLLQNSPGAVTTAWVLLLLLSAYAWLNWGKHDVVADVRGWFRREWPLVLMVEIVFFVALLAWAYLRAHNPELHNTEKPMEMAFINGVRNSTTFPPKDPWLAGYGISYYYFGYVMVASLADLSNIPTGLAFNLNNALIFALVTSAALSLGYNLVRSAGPLERWRGGTQSAGIGTGLLAAFFIAIMGNLGAPLIELPYAGYASDIPIADQIVSEDYFKFFDTPETSPPFYREVSRGGTIVYELLDRDGLSSTLPAGYRQLPDSDRDGIPNWDDDPPALVDYGFNWWHHSRLIHDINLSGVKSGEAITEFPQFSFLLADNHPHVLALPFTLLMIALALALLLRGAALPPWAVLLYGIFAGGMIFLNAWDAVYVVVLIAAEVLRRLLRNGTAQLSGWGTLLDIFSGQKRLETNIYLGAPVFLAIFFLLLVTGTADLNWFGLVDLLFQAMVAAVLTFPAVLFINWLLTDTDWAGVARFAIWLGLIFYIAYYPWIESFASQANGFYPNILFSTRSPQFFLQFGIFLLLFLPFVGWQAWQHRRRISWGGVLTIVLVGMVLLLAVPLLSAFVIDSRCPIENGLISPENADNPACDARRPLFGEISSAGASIVAEVFVRRLQALPTQLLMLFVLGVMAMRLFPKEPPSTETRRELYNFSPTVAALFLFLAAGATAALLPDLLYLRDNFDTRMNTIFKLYYQAWTLFSLTTAYIVYLVLRGMPRQHQDVPEPDRMTVEPAVMGLRFLYSGGLLILLLAGSLYPYLGLRQHYLADTGRLSARECVAEERERCPEERLITLDGSETLIGQTRSFPSRSGQERYWSISRDEFAVMNCLLELEPRKNDAILVEAAGGGYDPQMGRFAMYTGIPTLLGWDNHERQWRGIEGFATVVDGTGRWSDVHRLYEMSAEAWQIQGEPIVERYGIDYVIVGEAERNVYSDATGAPLPGLDKFALLFDPVCQQGNTAVYRVSAE